MHAVTEEFDPTELRRALASSETTDLRTFEFGPDKLRSSSTTSERETHLHIYVPAITRGTLTRPHELKMNLRSFGPFRDYSNSLTLSNVSEPSRS